MKNTLKSIGSFFLGVCILVGVIFILMMFIKGGVWLSERLYWYLEILTTIALFVVFLILLPLTIFRFTRAFAGGGMFFASYVFGLTLWVWSLLISYSVWGIFGLVTGLLIGGIGVIPIAILATLFNGMWSIVGQLLLLTMITFGVRLLGIWILLKSEDHGHTSNNQL